MLSNCFRFRRRAALGFQIHGAEKRQDSVPADVLCTALLVPVFACLIIIIGMGGKMILPTLPEGVTTDYMFPQLIMNYLNPILGSRGSDRHLRGRSIHSQLHAAALLYLSGL